MVHIRVKDNGHLRPKRKMRTIKEFDDYTTTDAELRGEEPNSLFDHEQDRPRWEKRDADIRRKRGSTKSFFFGMGLKK